MRNSLRNEVGALYRAHGPRHLVPFIGPGYESTEPLFRLLVLGINAYVSSGDWPRCDAELQGWYPAWWSAAGQGKAHRFFQTAWRESDELARALVNATLFPGLRYDPDPVSKPCVYGTNAVKVFLGETHKKADVLTAEDLAPYASTWHAELDVLAKHGRFPHLILVYGEAVWETVWRSLNIEMPDTFPNYRHLRVVAYATTGDLRSPSYHWVNRVEVETAGGCQTTLLVRLHHPATQSRPRRAPAWLLEQEHFQRLAGLSKVR